MDATTPDELPLERLEAEITELAAHLAAGECRWLSFVAAYDRREGWRQWGCHSCAFWLSWKCGVDLRTAREKLRVAHALEVFPRIREAFAAGRLSYSKARALTRIAGLDTEADLVEMALHATAAQLAAIAAGYGRVERAECRPETADPEPGGDPARRRRVDIRDHDDPNLETLIASLTREEMDLVNRALDAAGQGVSRADGLVLMAESFLANGHACRQGSDRTLAMITVEDKVLDGDDTGVARIVGGSALSPETARRMCCDASLTWLLRGDNGEPVNISSKQPSIPRALRRLVKARDQGRCRFPGCGEARYTEIHHLVHRADGGEHTRANLATLCWFHHRLVHEGAWSLHLDPRTGTYVATNPAGVPLRAATPQLDGDPETLHVDNAADGHTIDATTPIAKWGGERLDLGWAVTSLWYANHPDDLAIHAAQAARCRAAA